MTALRGFLLFVLLFALVPQLSAQSLRCTVCGKILRGQYLVSDEKAYCSQNCFDKTLPKCATCGKVLRDNSFQYKNRHYCSIDCMKQVLPKCDSCRQPIAGKYGIYETPTGKKRMLCHRCSLFSRCFACELPGRSTRLPDGRYLCNACARESIRDRKEAEALFQEVRDVTEKILGEQIRCPLRLHVVDYPTLRKITNLQLDETAIELGYCRCNMLERKTGNVSEIVGYRCDIYLLDSLPRWRFIEIAAHELAHHWQYHKFPYLKTEPRKIPEGFAEYVSSLVNRAYRQEHLNRAKLERRDFIYGSGYKLFLGIAEQGGLASVFRYLRQQEKSGKESAGLPES